MTDFNKILSKAKEIESKMKESQKKIKNINVTGISGGNAVKLTLDGEGELISLDILLLSSFLPFNEKFLIFCNSFKCICLSLLLLFTIRFIFAWEIGIFSFLKKFKVNLDNVSFVSG